nr:MAG TPA: hypothetical protein [Caudoviricetes sp.]
MEEKVGEDSMDRKSFMRNYWMYYLMLEERFIQSTRYIEPVEDNEEVYSLEYVNQLQAIGSEIDVLMKVICNISQSARKTIADYYPIIVHKIPNITTYRVRCYNFEFKPFETWLQAQPSQSLFWWDAYNQIKHGRVEKFKFANMKVVMYALSALCLLELLYLKEIVKNQQLLDRPDRESEIFRFPDINYQYINVGGGLILEMRSSQKDDPAEVDTLILDGGSL